MHSAGEIPSSHWDRLLLLELCCAKTLLAIVMKCLMLYFLYCKYSVTESALLLCYNAGNRGSMKLQWCHTVQSAVLMKLQCKQISGLSSILKTCSAIFVYLKYLYSAFLISDR